MRSLSGEALCVRLGGLWLRLPLSQTDSQRHRTPACHGPSPGLRTLPAPSLFGDVLLADLRVFPVARAGCRLSAREGTLWSGARPARLPGEAPSALPNLVHQRCRAHWTGCRHHPQAERVLTRGTRGREKDEHRHVPPMGSVVASDVPGAVAARGGTPATKSARWPAAVRSAAPRATSFLPAPESDAPQRPAPGCRHQPGLPRPSDTATFARDPQSQGPPRPESPWGTLVPRLPTPEPLPPTEAPRASPLVTRRSVEPSDRGACCHTTHVRGQIFT